MGSVNPQKILIEDITGVPDQFGHKSFILSEGSKVPRDVSFQQPFFFDGLIIGLCREGSGTVKINFKDHHVEQGSVLAILPRQIFRNMERTDDFKIEVMFVSTDFFSDLGSSKGYNVLLHMAGQPSLKIPGDTMESLLELYRIIGKHYDDNKKPYRDKVVKGLLFALIMEIGSAYVQHGEIGMTETSNRKEEITERFFKLLSQNFRHQRSVGFYADKMCLTPKYLSATVKSVTGHPILDWINMAVVIEAKTRLKTSDLTVLQISDELNFPNPSFFGRFFKQHVGMTPHKYRNQGV